MDQHLDASTSQPGGLPPVGSALGRPGLFRSEADRANIEALALCDPPKPEPAVCGPLGAGLATASAALAGVADAPAWQLTESELDVLIAESLRLRAMNEATLARLVADAEARGVPRVAGAASTRRWLGSTYDLSDSDAARIVARAKVHIRAAEEEQAAGAEPAGGSAVGGCLEPVVTAWAAGELRSDRAIVIARLLDKIAPDVPRDRVRAMVADLVASSRELAVPELRLLCRQAAEVLDPDTAEQLLGLSLEREERAALIASFLHTWSAGDGMVGFTGRLPVAQYRMLERVLDAYDAPRHHAAQRAAQRATQRVAQDRGPSQSSTPEGPDEPDLPELPDWRDGATRDQRRGIALAQLLEHLPVDKLPDHGASTPTVIVTIDADQLISNLGEALLDDETPVSPGQARRWACNANLVPAVLDGESAVLDLGRDQRLYNRRLRLALTVRDRGCIWPGCDRPPAWCEAHHITAWSKGGRTDLDNGCLLCPFHHHLVHLPETTPEQLALLEAAASDRDDASSPRWFGRRYAPINTRVEPVGGWTIRLGDDRLPEIVPPTRIDPQRRPRRHARFHRTERPHSPAPNRAGPRRQPSRT